MTFYPSGGSALAAPVTVLGTGTNTVFGAGTVGDTTPRIEMDADGGLRFSSGAGASDARLFRSGASILNVGVGNTLNVPFLNCTSGFMDVTTVGKGYSTAEGANAKQGTATLVAGTVTVANTSVTATSRIFLTGQVLGGTAGGLNVTSRVAGTSFTVTSTNAADTSTFAYEIFEVG